MSGYFCANCGQRNLDRRLSIGTILRDVLDDQLALNSALPRSLGLLFLHPGFLTREYINRRIARYIPPFRLYLISSLVFFLLLAIKTSDTEWAVQDMREAEREMATDTTGASASTLRDSIVATVRAATDSARAGADSARKRVNVGRQRQPGVIRFEGDELKLDSAGRPLENWAKDITVNTPWPVLTRALKAKLLEFGELPPDQAFSRFWEQMREELPKLVFLMLPVYAFFLKLLYIRKNVYYVEHFIFSLHVHAFTFIGFAAMLWAPDALGVFLMLWIFIYSYWAMKRVYTQGFIITAVKWWTLGILYSIALGLVAIPLVVISFLMA